MKKSKKAGFFAPDKLENHNSKGEGKEKEKELGGRKETKRKKGNGYTLKFYNGYFGERLTEEVRFGGSGKNPAGKIYTMPYIFILKLLHTNYCKK